jgi:hypothetical protein
MNLFGVEMHVAEMRQASKISPEDSGDKVLIVTFNTLEFKVFNLNE